MFLTTDQLLRQFEENLRFAEQIDIATAWATSGPALDMLCAARKRGAKIRAIVGTSGNATEPDALARLNEIGTLRLGVGCRKLFHPKVLIFRETRKSRAWIGSANFTRAGFASNEEVVHETSDGEDASRWFESRWRECRELTPNAIEDYRRRWTLNRPSSSFKTLIGALKLEDDDRLDYIRQARDWSGFVKALSRCQEWWNNHEWDKHHKCKWSVFGKTRSWVHTIERGLSIARRKNWSELPKEDARILLGLYVDGSLDSGLLGTMKGAGIAKNVFGDYIRKCRKGCP